MKSEHTTHSSIYFAIVNYYYDFFGEWRMRLCMLFMWIRKVVEAQTIRHSVPGIPIPSPVAIDFKLVELEHYDVTVAAVAQIQF